MIVIINYLKRLYYLLGNDRHIIVSFTDGSTSFFPASNDAEVEALMDFILEHNWQAIAVMLGDDDILINFMNVTKVEIIEPWSI